METKQFVKWVPEPSFKPRQLVGLQNLYTNCQAGFPWWLSGKESAFQAGEVGLIPGLRRSPGEGNGNPLQFLPGKSHGQRSLEGYSPWGHKRIRQSHWRRKWQPTSVFAWKIPWTEEPGRLQSKESQRIGPTEQVTHFPDTEYPLLSHSLSLGFTNYKREFTNQFFLFKKGVWKNTH